MNLDSTFVREFDVEKDVVLKIHQSMIGDEGCVVWDAALVLAKFITHNNELRLNLLNSNVIELGAGTGIVGITAAVLGADVVLTDVEEYVSLLQKNIESNQLHFKGKIKACSLRWGEFPETLKNYIPTYILVSDCLYYEQSLDPLISTLDTLSDEQTTIIFSYEKRTSKEKLFIESEFFKRIKMRFLVEEVDEKDLHPDFHSPDIKVLLFTKM